MGRIIRALTINPEHRYLIAGFEDQAARLVLKEVARLIAKAVPADR